MVVPSEGPAARLVGLVYEAATTPDGWPVVLGALASELRSQAPALNLTGRERDRGTLWISVSDDPDWRSRYDEYFVDRDPRRRRIQRTRQGGVFIGSEIFPDRTLRESEFYNDFLRPQGLFHILGGVPIKDAERMAVIRFLRPETARPFSGRERALLATLMPHLCRALSLHYDLANLRADHAAAHGALDLLAHGIVLLDGAGNVVAANQRAREILDRQDGLVVQNGALGAHDPVQHDRLGKAIARNIDGDGPPVGLRLTRPSGAGRLALRIERLPERIGHHLAERAVIAVFIDDPQRHELPSLELVSGALGLTRSQARLARALCGGQPLPAIARELGIAHGTARKHVAHACKRTGTHSQKELVRLVVALGGRSS